MADDLPEVINNITHLLYDTTMTHSLVHICKESGFAEEFETEPPK
jgi:hypothetical protein